MIVDVELTDGADRGKQAGREAMRREREQGREGEKKQEEEEKKGESGLMLVSKGPWTQMQGMRRGDAVCTQMAPREETERRNVAKEGRRKGEGVKERERAFPRKAPFFPLHACTLAPMEQTGRVATFSVLLFSVSDTRLSCVKQRRIAMQIKGCVSSVCLSVSLSRLGHSRVQALFISLSLSLSFMYARNTRPPSDQER